MRASRVPPTKPPCVIALAIALAIVIADDLNVGVALVAVGVLNPLYVVNMVLQMAMIPFAWGLWKGSRKAWLYLQLMLGATWRSLPLWA